MELTSRRQLIRQQRRLVLEIRTLTISLQDAMRDLQSDTTSSPEDRLRLSREWAERVRVLLQDCRVRQMRINALLHHQASLHREDRESVTVFDDRAEQALREAELEIRGMSGTAS